MEIKDLPPVPESVEKRGYMLEASLNVLHEESREWQQQLEFWKHEINFLQRLLEKDALKAGSQDDKKTIESLQNRIIYYRDELLPQLAHDVAEHEKILAEFLQNEHNDDQSYRDQHNKLNDQIYKFQNGYQDLKKDMFQFSEQVLG